MTYFCTVPRQPNGRCIVKTLGKYPALGIADVHKQVASLKEKHDSSDLFTDNLEDAPKAFKQLVEIWYRDYALKERKNPEQAWGVIEKNLLPVIGNRKLSSITPLTVTNLVKGVVNRGASYCILISRNVVKNETKIYQKMAGLVKGC